MAAAAACLAAIGCSQGQQAAPGDRAGAQAAHGALGLDTSALDSGARPGEEQDYATANDAQPLQLVGSDEALQGVQRRLLELHNRPTEFKPAGTSSIVFRVSFPDDVLAAFKPETTSHGRAYQREVAAYRLARALKLANVPPAILAAYSKKQIAENLQAPFADLWPSLQQRIVWKDQAITMGALIHWMEDMRPANLAEMTEATHWKQWLSQQGEIPQGREDLARDLSNMLTFDYLIGNWDRFSGGNFKRTVNGDRLVFLDHNSAFGVPLRDRIHRRVYERFRDAEKFSASLYAQLMALDGRILKHLVATEQPDVQLLSDAQQARVLDRRDTILSYIQSLIELHGRDEVMVFD